MQNVRLSRDGPIAVITMARGKANALESSMVEELMVAAAAAADEDSVRGVVLASDCPRFFSAGFDVVEVFQYDRFTMSVFLARFGELASRLYLLNKPLVAAVTGHAIAAGAVLALTADFRIVGDGDFGFALNEVTLGVVAPPGVVRLLADVVGPGPARRLILTGEQITPARSLELGLASEVLPADMVLERALALAHSLAEKPAAGFAGNKASLRAALSAGSRPGYELPLAPPVEAWFTPEAEDRKRTMLALMRK